MLLPAPESPIIWNVEIRVTQGNKEVYTDFGEMLFTHYGVSGPVVLSASSHLTQPERGVYNLHIDLKPALAFDVLDPAGTYGNAVAGQAATVGQMHRLYPPTVLGQFQPLYRALQKLHTGIFGTAHQGVYNIRCVIRYREYPLPSLNLSGHAQVLQQSDGVIRHKVRKGGIQKQVRHRRGRSRCAAGGSS